MPAPITTRSKRKKAGVDSEEEVGEVESPVSVNAPRKGPKKGRTGKDGVAPTAESNWDEAEDADGGGDDGSELDDVEKEEEEAMVIPAVANLAGKVVNIPQSGGVVTDSSTLTSDRGTIETIRMLEDNNRTIAKERDALKERVKLYQLEKDAKISKNINSKVGRGKNAFLKSLTAHDKQQGSNVAALLKLSLFPKVKFLLCTPEKKWYVYSTREGSLSRVVMVDCKVQLPTGMNEKDYWNSVMAPYTNYIMGSLRNWVVGGVREQWNGRIAVAIVMCASLKQTNTSVIFSRRL